LTPSFSSIENIQRGFHSREKRNTDNVLFSYDTSYIALLPLSPWFLDYPWRCPYTCQVSCHGTSYVPHSCTL